MSSVLDFGRARVENGTQQVFNHWSPKGPMWTGSGGRSVTSIIRFSKKYDDDPIVHISPTTVDASNGGNLRYNVEVIDVTNENFTVKVSTWGDTKLATVHISWMAIGKQPKP